MADQPPATERPATPGQLPVRTRPPAPGYDEITIQQPPARTLCSSAEHRRLGVLAEVIITFGELGTAWQKDALWQTSWHKAFAVCPLCWEAIRQTAQERRPGLKLTEIPAPRHATIPPPPATPPLTAPPAVTAPPARP